MKIFGNPNIEWVYVCITNPKIIGMSEGVSPETSFSFIIHIDFNEINPSMKVLRHSVILDFDRKFSGPEEGFTELWNITHITNYPNRFFELEKYVEEINIGKSLTIQFKIGDEEVRISGKVQDVRAI